MSESKANSIFLKLRSRASFKVSDKLDRKDSLLHSAISKLDSNSEFGSFSKAAFLSEKIALFALPATEQLQL